MILLASIITLFNLFFIVYVVPESLPESLRKTSWGSPISWKQADPFAVREISLCLHFSLSLFQALDRAGSDTRLLLLSIMVFLSYLPEAGQYSCFFLYLRQVRGGMSGGRGYCTSLSLFR